MMHDHTIEKKRQESHGLGRGSNKPLQNTSQRRYCLSILACGCWI